MNRTTRWLGGIGLVVMLVLLCSPVPAPNPSQFVEPQPFRWDRDGLFGILEEEFRTARHAAPDARTAALRTLESHGDSLLTAATREFSPSDDLLRELETVQFRIATIAAADSSLLPDASRLITRTRVSMLRAAAGWEPGRPTHEALYRIVYGGRAALEEALVQAGPDALPALRLIEPVPSGAPYTLVHGVRVHSGDILLSRGGAPTSALIARGNDFPGSFSHVALVHVDDQTGVATVIESLIEHGVVRSAPEEYLQAKKRRVLLLRLRDASGDLSHRAATAMLERARSERIRYDFPMDWQDPDAMFCSEVVYHAYLDQGLDLWAIRSAMSSPGLMKWLAGLGVKHFLTLVPSDLEYDPRLAAVAEWRDVDALRAERRDNAAMDALLEAADEGYRLGYEWYRLPAARVLRLAGRLPPGMSAPAALRVEALNKRVFPVIIEKIEAAEQQFRDQQGYHAPYWELVRFAHDAVREHAASLTPGLMR